MSLDALLDHVEATLGNPHAVGIREGAAGGPIPVFATDEDWEAGMKWYFRQLIDDPRNDPELRTAWAIEAER